jgi:arabinogalactan oligomer / maltooligosaccharide transport system permease protein
MTDGTRGLPLGRQLLYQALCLLVLAIVLLPVLWIVAMALDPRDIARPTSLIPPGASARAFVAVVERPTPNAVSFLELARNSFLLAGGVALFTVVIGTSAAYAFSRFRFPGRQIGMLSFVLVLMLPPIASLAALFVMLNIIIGPDLRNSLTGVGLAMTASALPFAIWNMKGYIDTIPKELEEAAVIDGASPHQTFLQIMLPLALPALAVTLLFGFMAGWTEFALSWQFISRPEWFTLSMALYGMQGQYASNTPWSQFAAMSIFVSLPVVLVFFALQRYIVSGLASGGVKG